MLVRVMSDSIKCKNDLDKGGCSSAMMSLPVTVGSGAESFSQLSARLVALLQLLTPRCYVIRLVSPPPPGSAAGSAAGVLQEAILDDVGWTPEGWSDIARRCREQDRSQLAQEILTVLSSQDGTVLLSPDAEGARLMEHIFM